MFFDQWAEGAFGSNLKLVDYCLAWIASKFVIPVILVFWCLRFFYLLLLFGLGCVGFDIWVRFNVGVIIVIWVGFDVRVGVGVVIDTSGIVVDITLAIIGSLLLFLWIFSFFLLSHIAIAPIFLFLGLVDDQLGVRHQEFDGVIGFFILIFFFGSVIALFHSLVAAGLLLVLCHFLQVDPVLVEQVVPLEHQLLSLEAEIPFNDDLLAFVLQIGLNRFKN